MFKMFIQKKLEKYVRRYFRKHPEVKLVVVAGSVGKTSTKVAIATVLSERFKVRLHEGNHNSELSAPLAILGVEYPSSIRDPRAWLRVFSAARERVNGPTDIDVIVQEIGTERIGEIPRFGRYLHPDIAVVTAVSPEHMNEFHTVDNVAQEELTAANFSKTALINRDDIDGVYAKYLTNPNVNTYGTSGSAEYHFVESDFTLDDGHKGDFVALEWDEPIAVTIKVIGEHNIRPAVAAGAVGVKLGMSATEIAEGLAKVHAVPGRMNLLRGFEDTILLDDTYNSSPLAVSMALQTLYKLSVPQRIAVLGSMNDMDNVSEAEHTAIGKLCDPNQLAWVITVGDEAEKYLAPAARARGCQVKSFKTAVQAGAFVRQVMESGAAILFKGSQADIFLEEAVKVILLSVEDQKQLVRQSPAWLKEKADLFSQF
jgi:UDP-N-acetylmuramoyl-tripeptide--D-alanyl-D-alanine ligase